MSAVLYEPAFSVLVRWFGSRRALALSILTSVGGFASTVFVPLTGWLTSHGSWRSAVLSLAIAVGVTTIPVHAFVLRASSGTGREDDADAALPSGVESGIPETVTPPALPPRLDWWLALAFACSTLGNAAAAVHVIPFLLALGHSLAFASFVVALMGAAQVPGRLLFAPLLRVMPERALAPTIFGAQAVGLLFLAASGRAAAPALLFALLFGSGSG